MFDEVWATLLAKMRSVPKCVAPLDSTPLPCPRRTAIANSYEAARVWYCARDWGVRLRRGFSVPKGNSLPPKVMPFLLPYLALSVL